MGLVPKSVTEKVSIGHTTVLVIDMQNAFCADQGTSTGRLDKSIVRAIIPGLKQFLLFARSKRVPIIFIRAVMDDKDFSPAIRDLTARHYGREVRYCLRGSWEAEFIPEIQPLPEEPVIEKSRYSAFFETKLDSVLRALSVATVLVTGVTTNVCVDTTCRDAYMRGYYVVVPSDLVASVTPDLHQAALKNIDRYFGVITTSAEVLEAWRG